MAHTSTYTPSNDQDELNPAFIFNGTYTELLCAIATGKIDANELAKKELSNRGIDMNTGEWVGFKKAAIINK